MAETDYSRKHALECIRMAADSMRIRRRCPEPCFAVAFRSDGDGMVRPSGSRTECGYSDGKREPKLQRRNKRVTWPARELRDGDY